MSIYTFLEPGTDFDELETDTSNNATEIAVIKEPFDDGMDLKVLDEYVDSTEDSLSKTRNFLEEYQDLSGIKLVAADAVNNINFGCSISMDGDYCIVGARYEDTEASNAGAAYIFHRAGTNAWDAGTKIVAPDAEADDQFGFSVSISGDYCVVGAPYEETGGNSAGAAYVFHRTGTNTWDAGTKIVASDAEADDYFGHAVSISGDYCVVGAYYEDTGGDKAGAAYIYHRTDTNTWDAGIKIVASDAEASDNFGEFVSIDGDYCAVGAPTNEKAYIFHRTGTNAWEEFKLNPSGSKMQDFGASVSISGDYCVIDPIPPIDSEVYFFHRTGLNTWDTGNKVIVIEEGYNYDRLGVSISGDYCIVLAGEVNKVFTYKRTDGDNWNLKNEFFKDLNYSTSISLSGNTFAIGCNEAAYIYNML